MAHHSTGSSISPLRQRMQQDILMRGPEPHTRQDYARHVRSFAASKGFEALPLRWVVEWTFASLGRCRRLAKDFERSIESAQAWVSIANIRMPTRRLARLENTAVIPIQTLRASTHLPSARNAG